MTDFNRDVVLADVRRECKRQIELWGDGPNDLRSSRTPIEHGYMVLGEEFGEVGRALLEGGFQEKTGAERGKLTQGQLDHLREELIQCAAVCVAWVEGIDLQ